jgi:phage/plasmid-like protein (TIGR03299 family)
MSHEIESMFSLRTTPWHNLGIVVQDAPTSLQALDLAGLNWEVVQKPIYTQNAVFNFVHSNVIPQIEEVEIPGFKANVRETDGKVLGVVSDQYKIVQNWEAFEFTDYLLSNGARYETAGSLAGGKRVWMCAKLDSKYLLGDEHVFYLVFSNCHDGTGAIKVMITPIRVVCQNTLNMAIAHSKRSWSTKHQGNMSYKLDEAKQTLGMAHNYIEKFSENVVILGQKKVDKVQFENFLELLLPISDEVGNVKATNIETLREGIRTRYNYSYDLGNIRGTALGVLNAVSDFATHSEPLRKSPNYKENLFAKTIDGNPMIDKAYELIMA